MAQLSFVINLKDVHEGHRYGSLRRKQHALVGRLSCACFTASTFIPQSSSLSLPSSLSILCNFSPLSTAMTESILERKHWYSPTADVIRTSFKQFKGFIKGKKPEHEKGQPDSQANERPTVSAAHSLKQSIPEHISTPRSCSDPIQVNTSASVSHSDEVPSPEPTNHLPQVLPLPTPAPLVKSLEVASGSTDTLSEPGPISTPACSRTFNQEPKEGDIVMIVMGPTGVGKTTFINSFDLETYSLEKVGHHDLDAGTKKLEFLRVNMNLPNGQSLVLVDTPGFDDPKRSNADVLTCIAEFLESQYRKKKYLAGLIYLHRITDIRFDSGVAGSMNIFRKLYGSEGYDRLALVTTMWNDVRPDLKKRYEDKETELRNNAWGTFINRSNSALMARFDASNDDTKTSAANVVTELIQNSLKNPGELRLKIQRELVDDGTKLPRTTAGKAAFSLAETAKFYLKEVTS